MTEFDPEKFTDKYEHYFPELQTAYRNAFEQMNAEYGSDLVHAIDQQILNESEPFYEPSERGDGCDAGRFRVELPENPAERVTGVVVANEKLRRVLDTYVETLTGELHAVFGVERVERDGTDGE